MIILIGVMMSAIGFVLAINLKGIVTTHVAISSRAVGSLNPLRRGLSAERLAQRENDMVRLERAIGTILLLFGLFVLARGVWDLLF